MRRSLLGKRLEKIASSSSNGWMNMGATARPNLHGILRYPAMMVPRMQGDIIDCILQDGKDKSEILDPFVGSGTTLTESTIRGLNFTGVDINPLAALVCDAKVAIDGGVDIDDAAQITLRCLRVDVSESIDVSFENREKWFSDQSSIVLSKLRRSIMNVESIGARKVLWTVFAETIRLCSNSRTSTYKLHVRRPEDCVEADRVREVFELSLRKTIERIKEYRVLIDKDRKRPEVKIICGDIRRVSIPKISKHRIVVTSPPYGDNVTTIPYGQFSYLALKWVPRADLSVGAEDYLYANTHALDSASLGGTSVNAEYKEAAMKFASPAFAKYVRACAGTGAASGVRKTSCFLYDFLEAMSQVKDSSDSSAHWVMTTGNRTAAGAKVPFDAVCLDIVKFLGGQPVAVIKRDLPTKRMPSMNSMGAMITTESTLVAEFV